MLFFEVFLKQFYHQLFSLNKNDDAVLQRITIYDDIRCGSLHIFTASLLHDSFVVEYKTRHLCQWDSDWSLNSVQSRSSHPSDDTLFPEAGIRLQRRLDSVGGVPLYYVLRHQHQKQHQLRDAEDNCPIQTDVTNLKSLKL